ncbi:MAG: phosphopentomutase [Eubacteriaceae bacterium]|nr:phosphopentomutase [Eubacteriaceae bacterium]
MFTNKKVVLIVLDSVGIGYLPDAFAFNSEGANTLGHVYEHNEHFSLPFLEAMGLGLIAQDPIPSPPNGKPIASYGKMAEKSAGMDTTAGHWEIAGVVSTERFNIYENGFPQEIIDEFTQKNGVAPLCNKPYSGTDVIRDYGIEHIETLRPIVYTSADSVFQIAAHEEAFGMDRLYKVCETTRELLNKYNIGRVIARPFLGDSPSNFYRTSNRKDYSLPPSKTTVLDIMASKGFQVCSIGKISDIFAARGITMDIHTTSNNHGMEETIRMAKEDLSGVIFTNLVDFDMVYGHRNDVAGYGKALVEFDQKLPELLAAIGDRDLLILTADHGCDPTFPGTDHTREYVPLLVYSKNIKPKSLGTRDSFADIAESLSEFFELGYTFGATSFL